MTSKDIPKPISLPDSEDGRMRSDLPDGLMTDPSGPVPVPVSRFRALDSEKALPTHDTCGPLFIGSSKDAALQSSLESRLRVLLAGNGSPLYDLTWEQEDMPAGVPICRLRASVRRISANDCIGWVSPTATDGLRGGKPARPHDKGVPLSQQVAGWGTPRVGNNGGHGNPERATDGKSRIEDQVQGWATPTARDMRSEYGSPEMMKRRAERPQGKPLSKQAILSGWATPVASDGNKNIRTPEGAMREAKRKSGNKDLGTAASLSPAPMVKRGPSPLLNPAFSRWLMGYPAEWDDCAPTETR